MTIEDLIGIEPQVALKKIFKDIDEKLNVAEILIAKCFIDSMYEHALSLSNIVDDVKFVESYLNETLKPNFKASITLEK